MSNSNNLTNLLIGSGAGFSIGFISGILFALRAPNPREVLFKSMLQVIIEFIQSLPLEAKVIGILIPTVILLSTVIFRLQELLEIIAGGVLCYILGFVTGIFLASNIQLLVLIAIIMLLVASRLGWLKR